MYNQYMEQKTRGGDNKGAQQRQRQAEKQDREQSKKVESKS
jgi:hypothetical protein